MMTAISLAAAISGASAGQGEAATPRPSPAPVACPDVVYRIANSATRACPPEELMLAGLSPGRADGPLNRR